MIGSLETLSSWQVRLPRRYSQGIRKMYLRAGVGGDTRHAAGACRWLKVGPRCLACRGPRGAARNSLPYLDLTLGAAVPRRKEA